MAAHNAIKQASSPERGLACASKRPTEFALQNMPNIRVGAKQSAPHQVRRASWKRQLTAGWAGAIRTRGMTESKSVALPLGYSPIYTEKDKRFVLILKSGVEDGTRTHDLQSHNLAL